MKIDCVIFTLTEAFCNICPADEVAVVPSGQTRGLVGGMSPRAAMIDDDRPSFATLIAQGVSMPRTSPNLQSQQNGYMSTRLSRTSPAWWSCHPELTRLEIKMANPATESLEMQPQAVQPDPGQSREALDDPEQSNDALRPAEHEDRRVRLSGKRASTLVGQAILQLPIWGMHNFIYLPVMMVP